MSSMHLTKRIVESLMPESRETVVWDEALPGFGIRVKANGARSYLVQYRNRSTGESRRLTIGRHGPLLTFDQAKKLARGVLADAMRGLDPAAERHEQRKAPTMSDLAEDYMSRHARPRKRASSVQSDQILLKKHILPKLGGKKVAAVTLRDVESLHLAMKATPYQANRMVALLSKAFNLAISWGWRADNPAKGIIRFQEEKRDRWLSDEELRRLCGVLDAYPDQMIASVFRFQLLTGARRGEVLSAKRAAFDLERGVWTKPSHQTKQKRTEHVPLSSQALALVFSVIEKGQPTSPFLFHGYDPSKPLKDVHKAWGTITRAAELPGYRQHDNRHTYASHLVSSGLSLVIVGRLLGHSSPSTTQRYAHLADDPMRQATERFGEKLERVSRLR